MLALLVLTGCWGGSEEHSSRASGRVIYDADSREELVSSAYSSLGDVTLALIPAVAVEAIGANVPHSSGAPPRWCPGERFGDQPRVAVCDAVALTPHYALTAGHCVPDQDTCERLAFVRNYAMPIVGELTLDVFDCDDLVFSKRSHLLELEAFDFAIVRLSQPLPDLPDRAVDLGIPARGETAISIGSSSGLPLKVSSGIVDAVDSRNGYFRLAIDVAAGSSGAGVFNERGQLTGMVVAGSQDYVEGPGGCLTARVISSEQQGAGELANSASAVIQYACTHSDALPFCGAYGLARDSADTLSTSKVTAVGGGCGVGQRSGPARPLHGLVAFLGLLAVYVLRRVRFARSHTSRLFAVLLKSPGGSPPAASTGYGRGVVACSSAATASLCTAPRQASSSAPRPHMNAARVRCVAVSAPP